MPERRVRLRGGVHIALDAAEALALFTPVGERRWVEGWAPEFPAGEEGDGGERGTVFVTGRDGATTYWVVVARTATAVRYARVTPGVSAGEVAVVCREHGDDDTLAEVTYDLTALSAEGAEELASFAAGYTDFLAGWQREIAAVI